MRLHFLRRFAEQVTGLSVPLAGFVHPKTFDQGDESRGHADFASLGRQCVELVQREQQTKEEYGTAMRVRRQLRLLLAPPLACVAERHWRSEEQLSVALYGSSVYGLAGHTGDADCALARVLDRQCPTTGERYLHTMGFGYKSIGEEQEVLRKVERILRSSGRMEGHDDDGDDSLRGIYGARVPVIKMTPPCEYSEHVPEHRTARTIVITAVTGDDDDCEDYELDDSVGVELRDVVRKLVGCEAAISRRDGGFAIEVESEDLAVSLAARCQDATRKRTGAWPRSWPLGAVVKVRFLGSLPGEKRLFPTVFHNDADISVRFSGPRGTLYLRRCVELNLRWHVFFFVAKYIGKTVGVIDGASMLSSYAFLLMAVDFMRWWCPENDLAFEVPTMASVEFKEQNEESLPWLSGTELCDAEATGKALTDFFLYYADQFDYKHWAIVFPDKIAPDDVVDTRRRQARAAETLRQGGRVGKYDWPHSKEGMMQGWDTDFCIFDPAESVTNLGRKLNKRRLVDFRSRMRRVHQALVSGEDWMLQPVDFMERVVVAEDSSARVVSPVSRDVPIPMVMELLQWMCDRKVITGVDGVAGIDVDAACDALEELGGRDQAERRREGLPAADASALLPRIISLEAAAALLKVDLTGVGDRGVTARELRWVYRSKLSPDRVRDAAIGGQSGDLSRHERDALCGLHRTLARRIPITTDFPGLLQLRLQEPLQLWEQAASSEKPRTGAQMNVPHRLWLHCRRADYSAEVGSLLQGAEGEYILKRSTADAAAYVGTGPRSEFSVRCVRCVRMRYGLREWVLQRKGALVAKTNVSAAHHPAAPCVVWFYSDAQRLVGNPGIYMSESGERTPPAPIAEKDEPHALIMSCPATGVTLRLSQSGEGEWTTADRSYRVVRWDTSWGLIKEGLVATGTGSNRRGPHRSRWQTQKQVEWQCFRAPLDRSLTSDGR
eukprot:TRINITY_DN12005_c0_g1_i1.p1 TRINITY_DN12005_c0_g1~~TRINITY_DN12005_c0_g1_i1.p1  ORF type:complete len:949 (+),score=215.45 TRINITY_DN12005_c0_g1_i1:2038-4884(+)